jgi:hypothetical protein
LKILRLFLHPKYYFLEMKKILLLVLLGPLNPFLGHLIIAQDDALGVLTASKDDANALLESYLKPFGEGVSSSLGQNWFNTANCLKLLRPNVQVGLTLLRIPESSHYFDPSQLNLKNLKPVGTNPNSVPTLSAPSNAATPRWKFVTNITDTTQPGGMREVVLDTLPELLRGLDLQQIFVPYAQFNLGIGGNSELNIRYAPKLDLANLGSGVVPANLLKGQIAFWGIGVKHEVLQWIPLAKRLPLSLSIYVNHSRLKYTLDASISGPLDKVYPRNIAGIILDTFQLSGSSDFEGQQLSMEGRATSYGLVISKKILMLTAYGSIGAQNSSFIVTTEGNYPIRTGLVQSNTNPGYFTETWTSLERPVDFSIKSSNQLRLGIGARVKLGILAVHAEAFKLGAFNGYCGGLTVGF